MDAVPCDTSCPGAVGKNWNPRTCGLGNPDGSESDYCLCNEPCGKAECGNPLRPGGQKRHLQQYEAFDGGGSDFNETSRYGRVSNRDLMGMFGEMGEPDEA